MTSWYRLGIAALVVVALAGPAAVGAEQGAILSLVETVEVGGRPQTVMVDTDQERHDVLFYDRDTGGVRILDGDTLTLETDTIALPTADWETRMAYDRENHRTYVLTTERVGTYPNTWMELTVNVLTGRQLVNRFSVNAQHNRDPSSPADTVYEVEGLVLKQPMSEGANPGRLIIDNPHGGTLDVVDLDATGVETTTVQRHAYRAPVPTTGYVPSRGNTLALEPRHETLSPDDLGATDLLYIADLNNATKGHVRALGINQAPNPLQVSALPDVDLTGHWPFANGNQGVAATGDRDLLYVASGLQSFERGYLGEVDTRTGQVTDVIELQYADEGFVHSDWYDPKRVFIITSDGFSFDAPDYGYYLHLIYDGQVVDTLRLGEKFEGKREREVRDMVFDPYHRRLYVTLDTTVLVVDVNYGAAAPPLPEPAPVVTSIEIGSPWYGGTLETPDGDVSFTFINWGDRTTTVTYKGLTQLPQDALRNAHAASVGPGTYHTLLMYSLEAEVNATGEMLTEVDPYYATIHYRASASVESTLGLYRWDSGSWVEVPGSAVNTTTGVVTASPNHMGIFAVRGEAYGIFLPLVVRE